MSFDTPQADIVIRMPATHGKLLMDLLENLSEYQGCAGCNDYPVKINQENQAEIAELATVIGMNYPEDFDAEWLKKQLADSLRKGEHYFNDMDITGLMKKAVRQALRDAGHTKTIDGKPLR